MSKFSDIDALKIKIFELEMKLAVSDIQFRSFLKLFELSLKAEGENLELFHEALREIEREMANEVSRHYADYGADRASLVKKYFDKFFPPISEKKS